MLSYKIKPRKGSPFFLFSSKAVPQENKALYLRQNFFRAIDKIIKICYNCLK